MKMGGQITPSSYIVFILNMALRHLRAGSVYRQAAVAAAGSTVCDVLLAKDETKI